MEKKGAFQPPSFGLPCSFRGAALLEFPLGVIGLCCPDVHNVMVLFSGSPDVHGQENELRQRRGLGGQSLQPRESGESQSSGSGEELVGRLI